MEQVFFFGSFQEEACSSAVSPACEKDSGNVFVHGPASIFILVGVVLGCTAAWHSGAGDCVSLSSSFHAWIDLGLV